MSTVINHECEVEWPSLGAGASGGGAAPPDRAVNGATPTPTAGQRHDPDADANHHDSWEMLSPEDDDDVGDDKIRKAVAKRVTIEDNNEDQEEPVLVPRFNPKILRHSASSPDLRTLHLIEELEGADDDDSDEDYDASKRRHAEDDFDLVSRPGSVMSLSSTSSSNSPWTSGISFKDALKAKPTSLSTITSGEVATDAMQIPPWKHRHHANKKTKKKVTPTFVVKPIKRCIHSTGDLQSLAAQASADPGHDDYGEILGATDAGDFYARKALGAKGRANGLKLRPDEAKRKEITMYKKQLQRQSQGLSKADKSPKK